MFGTFERLIDKQHITAEERDIAQAVHAKLPAAWRHRLDRRVRWSAWQWTMSIGKVVLRLLEEPAVAAAVAADDGEAFDAILRPLEAKHGGPGQDEFSPYSSWDKARLAGMLWLRGYAPGSCCQCGEYMGGDRSFGACQHGCPRPYTLPAPGTDWLTDEPVEAVQ